MAKPIGPCCIWWKSVVECVFSEAFVCVVLSCNPLVSSLLQSLMMEVPFHSRGHCPKCYVGRGIVAKLPFYFVHILNFIRVGIWARAYWLVVFHPKIDSLYRVFAWQDSNLMSCRVLETWRRRIEDDQLFILLHELSQVLLESFFVVKFHLALIYSHLCIVNHRFQVILTWVSHNLFLLDALGCQLTL